MRRKNKKIDMLNGSIWDKMIVFALPLAFTGMLQQLFNAADVAVLGRFVSNESMAGVGNNVPVIGLIIAFCMGLALGANVVVARLLGMKEPERANRAVHTALATAVIFGIGAAIVGECVAGPAMDWLSVPEAVRDDALTYLRVYLLGMPFIAIYNFLAAVMRSQGDTLGAGGGDPRQHCGQSLLRARLRHGNGGCCARDRPRQRARRLAPLLQPHNGRGPASH